MTGTTKSNLYSMSAAEVALIVRLVDGQNEMITFRQSLEGSSDPAIAYEFDETYDPDRENIVQSGRSLLAKIKSATPATRWTSSELYAATNALSVLIDRHSGMLAKDAARAAGRRQRLSNLERAELRCRLDEAIVLRDRLHKTAVLAA